MREGEHTDFDTLGPELPSGFDFKQAIKEMRSRYSAAETAYAAGHADEALEEFYALERAGGILARSVPVDGDEYKELEQMYAMGREKISELQLERSRRNDKERVIKAFEALPRAEADKKLAEWQERREKELDAEPTTLGRLRYTIEFVEIYSAAGLREDADTAFNDAYMAIENDASISDSERLQLFKRLDDALRT